MGYSTVVERHKTREVRVGSLLFGGQNPIWVQSMTSTHTEDVAGTLEQCRDLEQAGCELVRVTVPRAEALENVTEIRRRIGIPLICDIHFDYRMALGCLSGCGSTRKRHPRQDFFLCPPSCQCLNVPGKIFRHVRQLDTGQS